MRPISTFLFRWQLPGRRGRRRSAFRQSRRLALAAACVASLAALLFSLQGVAPAAAAEPLRLVVADKPLAAAFRQIADDSFVVEEADWQADSPHALDGVCRSNNGLPAARLIFVFSTPDDDGEGEVWRERLSIQGFPTLVVPPPRCGNGRTVCPEMLRIAHDALCSLQPRQRSHLDARLREAFRQLHLLAWSSLE